MTKLHTIECQECHLWVGLNGYTKAAALADLRADGWTITSTKHLCPTCTQHKAETIYGVFVWTGTNNYPIENAVTTRKTYKQAVAFADKHIDKNYVVREIRVAS